MSFIKSEDGKKWINFFVAILSVIAAVLSIRFIQQLGEWFELEAKIGSNFQLVVQSAGAVLGLITFLVIQKNKNIASHLKEVYAELVKVIWPDRDSVIKVTIGVIIALAIVSGIFVLVDYLAQKGLALVY
jgi:preprotein translocase subunit SecE